MKTVYKHVFPWVATVALAGCGGLPEKTQCQTQSDCLDGKVCSAAGYCVDPTNLPPCWDAEITFTATGFGDEFSTGFEWWDEGDTLGISKSSTDEHLIEITGASSYWSLYIRFLLADGVTLPLNLEFGSTGSYLQEVRVGYRTYSYRPEAGAENFSVQLTKLEPTDGTGHGGAVDASFAGHVVATSEVGAYDPQEMDIVGGTAHLCLE